MSRRRFLSICLSTATVAVAFAVALDRPLVLALRSSAAALRGGAITVDGHKQITNRVYLTFHTRPMRRSCRSSSPGRDWCISMPKAKCVSW